MHLDNDLDRARADASAFLRRHKAGVLATVSAEGEAHASTVYYTADGEFNVYLLTPASSRKYAAIVAHPQVAFNVSVPEVPQTLQMEGIAMDISLDEEAVKKKEELFEVLNSNPWFYGPITKLDPAETVIVWIKPTWVRWGDYAFAEAGTSSVLKEIPLER